MEPQPCPQKPFSFRSLSMRRAASSPASAWINPCEIEREALRHPRVGGAPCGCLRWQAGFGTRVWLYLQRRAGRRLRGGTASPHPKERGQAGWKPGHGSQGAALEAGSGQEKRRRVPITRESFTRASRKACFERSLTQNSRKLIAFGVVHTHFRAASRISRWVFRLRRRGMVNIE